MRNNGPVTGKAIPVNEGEELVSATNAKGVITYCNDTFRKISGFTSDELVGKAHNMVRHPEMPEEAFKQMWDRLKSGQPWMGIVKNRCKNGDHYWVDAYITPLKEDNEIIGYESVRVQPSPDRVERAELAYSRIKAGKPAVPVPHMLWAKSAVIIGLTLAIITPLTISAMLWSDVSVIAVIGIIIYSLVAGAFGSWILRRSQSTLISSAHTIINDPLAAYIYTGKADPQGEIQLAMLVQRARLRTALGRMVESAREVKQRSEKACTQVRNCFDGMAEQQRTTQHVSVAMQEMSKAVQDVAGGASETSTATNQALEQVGQGRGVLNQASNSMQNLSSEVVTLGEIIGRLSADSKEIAGVVDVINGIAEQTNLLALNAAIEAARAGEQGRGFAVVADEVRSLASKTQESTVYIQNIIERLGNATSDAGRNMDACEEMANACVTEMEDGRSALKDITESVTTIDGMAERIAVAVEEQSAVAVEIEHNTQSITQISSRAQDEVKTADQLSQEMLELSEKQLLLVERFS